MPSYSDIANFLQHAGPGAVYTLAFILLIIIFTNFRGYWHTDREYQMLAQDRDEWKSAAITATSTVHDQNEQVSKLTAIVESLTTSLALQRRQ